MAPNGNKLCDIKVQTGRMLVCMGKRQNKFVNQINIIWYPEIPWSVQNTKNWVTFLYCFDLKLIKWA